MLLVYTKCNSEISIYFSWRNSRWNFFLDRNLTPGPDFSIFILKEACPPKRHIIFNRIFMMSRLFWNILYQTDQKIIKLGNVADMYIYLYMYNMCMCVCVDIYLCIYMYIYVYTYIYIWIYINKYIFISDWVPRSFEPPDRFS